MNTVVSQLPCGLQATLRFLRGFVCSHGQFSIPKVQYNSHNEACTMIMTTSAGTERMYKLAQASFRALVMLPKAVLVSFARRTISKLACNSLSKYSKDTK